MELTMTLQDRTRLKVLTRIENQDLTIENASKSLAISQRQMYRILSKYRKEGDSGILHKLRGKSPKNKISDTKRKEIINIFKEKYSDYGPTLFSEKLFEYHNIEISPKTITRILKEAKLYISLRHRKAHRKKRDRRKSIGELVQFDGSYHKWFEDRGEQCCLLVAIDDANNQVMILFVKSESNESVLSFWKEYCSIYGIPLATYTDRHSSYYDSKGIPEFQRAMHDLNVQCIFARSPEAKGRVERMNRTLQDRLLKALREKNISNIDDANDFIRNDFQKQFNNKFAIDNKDLQDVHRSADGINLDNIFCFKTTRKVNNDFTIMLDAKYVQLISGKNPLPPPKTNVTVIKHLDGVLNILWNNNLINFEILDKKPINKNKIVYKPKVNHPWRYKYLNYEY